MQKHMHLTKRFNPGWQWMLYTDVFKKNRINPGWQLILYTHALKKRGAIQDGN